MQDQPLVIERTYNAPVDKVWSAITNAAEMKLWYFDIPGFRPEPDFEFSFIAAGDANNYVHLCKVTAVIPNVKLSYTWRYANRPGITEVTFELFAEGDKTRLKLTHTGIASLAGNGPDFERNSFNGGWMHILAKSLKDYLEGFAAN